MNQTVNYQLLKAQKRVKDIKGFYAHLFATFLILPFLIFVNLYTYPQFHWFWFAIGGWAVGLIIHAMNVFFIARITVKEDWQTNKMKTIMNQEEILPENYLNEIYYVAAKKQVKEIKGFYGHLVASLVAVPIIIYVNLTFVPGFHFFWLALTGIVISLLLHWFGVYGFEVFGLGKNWEKQKVKEIIQKI